jgi:hypothetical protein
VTGAVNDTVGRVDGELGGALERTGVTGAPERIVDGLTGPGKAVGQAVDRTAGPVRGLLDGDR